LLGPIELVLGEGEKEGKKGEKVFAALLPSSDRLGHLKGGKKKKKKEGKGRRGRKRGSFTMYCIGQESASPALPSSALAWEKGEGEKEKQKGGQGGEAWGSRGCFFSFIRPSAPPSLLSRSL